MDGVGRYIRSVYTVSSSDWNFAHGIMAAIVADSGPSSNLWNRRWDSCVGPGLQGGGSGSGSMNDPAVLYEVEKLKSCLSKVVSRWWALQRIWYEEMDLHQSVGCEVIRNSRNVTGSRTPSETTVVYSVGGGSPVVRPISGAKQTLARGKD